MTKKALPKRDDFLLPWERDVDGTKLETPNEIDPEKLRSLIFGLTTDKIRQGNELEDVKADRDTKADELRDALKKSETAEQTAERETRELRERAEKAEGVTNIENLKFRVALRHGLGERDALRLVGTTVEELDEDAKDYAKSLAKNSKEVTEEAEEETTDPRTKPTGQNAATKTTDRKVSEASKGIDMAREMGLIPPVTTATG